jgi:hypothetical protein
LKSKLLALAVAFLFVTAATVAFVETAQAQTSSSSINFSVWFSNNSANTWVANGTQVPTSLNGNDGIMLGMFYFGEGGANGAPIAGSGPYIIQNDVNTPATYTVTFSNVNFPVGMQPTFRLSSIGYMNTPNLNQTGIVNSTILAAGQVGVLFPSIVVLSGTAQNPDPYGGQTFTFSFDIIIAAQAAAGSTTKTIHVADTSLFPAMPGQTPTPNQTPQATASSSPQPTATPTPNLISAPTASDASSQQATTQNTTLPQSTLPTQTQTDTPQTNLPSATTQSEVPEYPTVLIFVVVLFALASVLTINRIKFRKHCH